MKIVITQGQDKVIIDTPNTTLNFITASDAIKTVLKELDTENQERLENQKKNDV